MSASQDEIKDKLREFAAELLDLRIPESSVNVETAYWMAGAINAFLSGDMKSIDHALGLVAERGGQSNDRKNSLIAQEIVAASPGTTDREIAQTIVTKYPQTFTKALADKQIARVRNNSQLMIDAWSDALTTRLEKND